MVVYSHEHRNLECYLIAQNTHDTEYVYVSNLRYERSQLFDDRLRVKLESLRVISLSLSRGRVKIERSEVPKRQATRLYSDNMLIGDEKNRYLLT